MKKVKFILTQNLRKAGMHYYNTPEEYVDHILSIHEFGDWNINEIKMNLKRHGSSDIPPSYVISVKLKHSKHKDCFNEINYELIGLFEYSV